MPEQDEVALKIDGRRFRYWSDIAITRSLDSHATIGFSAPFEPDRREFRDTFRPFSFRRIEALVGGEPLFVGTMVSVSPTTEPDADKVSVSGYALPGVLEDCCPPASELPLEFNDVRLADVARRLCSPFGLNVAFDADPGPPFKRVAVDPDAKVQDVLADLARQRGIVLSSTDDGSLLFWKSTRPGRPVARLVDTLQPVTKVTPRFSPQSYFSELTGFASSKAGSRGAKYTAKNERLAGTVRPRSFVANDVDPADIQGATKAKLGRMFGNMVSFQIELATWRDPSGSLWSPNTTLTLRAPGAMVYRETEFVVRSVLLRDDTGSQTAELDLVLPGAFSAEIPEALPWDE